MKTGRVLHFVNLIDIIDAPVLPKCKNMVRLLFMKVRNIIVFLLIAVLLAGCVAIPPEVTTPEPTEVITEPEVTDAPMEPATEPETDPQTEPETEAVTEPLPEPEDDDFVKIIDYIPDVVIDLRYSTENNHTGKVIYDFEDIWLRYGTVKKLMKVQEMLKED